MVYNKEPMQVLWDALKSLNAKIPIYKETMTEDDDSTPESYLLIRSDISNTPEVTGDGRTQVRGSDCDVLLVSKGIAANSTDLHNVNRGKVSAALNAAGITFDAYNLGYDDKLKSTQYSWSMRLFYIL